MVVAPTRSATFSVRTPDGALSGVPVDLAKALAARTGLPIEFMPAHNSGEVTEALASGSADVGFLPVDAERRQRIDFGPVYFVSDSTYLVPAGSRIRTLAEVDQPGVRVLAEENTATLRAVRRQLRMASVTSAKSIDEALDLIQAGKVDAFALTRQGLRPLLPRLPGARILDEAFQKLETAIAVPRDRPRAHAYVTAFMEDAKSSGLVQQALDRAGVAP